MNKSELIERIAEYTDTTKASAGRSLDAFINIVTESLQDEQDVVLVGFGTFKLIHRKARQGVNPQTGKKMVIGASKSVSFRVGKKLKESIN